MIFSWLLAGRPVGGATIKGLRGHDHFSASISLRRSRRLREIWRISTAACSAVKSPLRVSTCTARASATRRINSSSQSLTCARLAPSRRPSSQLSRSPTATTSFCCLTSSRTLSHMLGSAICEISLFPVLARIVEKTGHGPSQNQFDKRRHEYNDQQQAAERHQTRLAARDDHGSNDTRQN